jgi:hypothetical protein
MLPRHFSRSERLWILLQVMTAAELECLHLAVNIIGRSAALAAFAVARLPPLRLAAWTPVDPATSEDIVKARIEIVS